MDKGRSQEDYLEAILRLEQQNGTVRSVDVAQLLHYTKASVSRAMAALAKDNLVVFGGDKCLYLTPAGRTIATQVYEKHCFFTQMLEQAGVEAKQAAEEACRLEHVISDTTFQKVKAAYRTNHGPSAQRKSKSG